MGIPVTVTVDDYILMKKGGSQPYYARVPEDGSLWSVILEKAVAKLYGNYEMIVGG